MENCVFCNLANGIWDSATLYEDDDFRVILDLGPASRGHALILPKAHYANIYEIPAELAAKAIVLAKKMAGIMTEALNCDGFNIVQNNGEAAGQTVSNGRCAFTVRWCHETAAVTETEYRILWNGCLYNITGIDHQNNKRKSLKFWCEKVRR